MTNTDTSLFDRVHAARGCVRLAHDKLVDAGDADLEDAIGALAAAALVLDRLESDVMEAGDSLTNSPDAAQAPD